MNQQVASSTPRVLVLEPGRAERHYWRDLRAYRELFAILAWRDVAVRYEQTVIGIGWAVIRSCIPIHDFRRPICEARAAKSYPLIRVPGHSP